MKTDTIFYRIFRLFPSFLFELIDRPPNEAAAYLFSSVEVKQASFRIDGVFLPRGEAAELPILFTEVQFQLDPGFYGRFFSEIFLFLDKTELTNNWQGTVIYPSRNVESSDTARYAELLNPGRVRRIYLDELASTQSLAIETVKLIIEPEETAVTKARALIEQARQQIASSTAERDLIELIETILIYKFTQKSREEIEAMLGLGDIRQTRVYQEAKQEGLEEGELKGKLKTVPNLIALGLSVEQIAQALDLKVEDVRRAAQQQPSN